MQLELAIRNLEQIASSVPVTIVEHHALRGEEWRGRLGGVFEAASASGHSVVTAAEYAGEENVFLSPDAGNFTAKLRPRKSSCYGRRL